MFTRTLASALARSSSVHSPTLVDTAQISQKFGKSRDTGTSKSDITFPGCSQQRYLTYASIDTRGTEI